MTQKLILIIFRLKRASEPETLLTKFSATGPKNDVVLFTLRVISKKIQGSPFLQD